MPGPGISIDQDPSVESAVVDHPGSSPCLTVTRAPFCAVPDTVAFLVRSAGTSTIAVSGVTSSVTVTSVSAVVALPFSADRCTFVAPTGRSVRE